MSYIKDKIPSPLKKVYWKIKLLLIYVFRFIFYSKEKREYLNALTEHGEIALSEDIISIRETVRNAAEAQYGENWNMYSNALLPEILHSFDNVIKGINTESNKVDYLEIGSCQGLSMGFIGSLLSYQKSVGKLVSVDPYYEDGYDEGSGILSSHVAHISINKKTREKQ